MDELDRDALRRIASEVARECMRETTRARYEAFLKSAPEVAGLFVRETYKAVSRELEQREDDHGLEPRHS